MRSQVEMSYQQLQHEKFHSNWKGKLKVVSYFEERFPLKSQRYNSIEIGLGFYTEKKLIPLWIFSWKADIMWSKQRTPRLSYCWIRPSLKVDIEQYQWDMNTFLRHRNSFTFLNKTITELIKTIISTYCW